MRHTADIAHQDVVGLNEGILSLIATTSDEILLANGVTPELTAAVKSALKTNDQLAHRSGKLLVRPVLLARVNGLSPRIGNFASTQEKRVTLSAPFREVLIQWFACVREVALRSAAEAVIRFGLSRSAVEYIATAKWSDLRAILEGEGEYSIEFLSTLPFVEPGEG